MKLFSNRKVLLVLLLAQVALTFACTKSTENPSIPGNPANPVIEKGVVKGRVTDTRGNGIPNIKLVIEHTVYYGNYVFAITDQHGYYKTSVSNGSWQVTSQLELLLNGQTYKFDLHPDYPSAFAGTSGAIRNFTWKLQGAKPGGGYYGSGVAIYPEPGTSLELSDVEITLTPVGLLADGSTGAIITSSLTDIGGGEDGIPNIPIAKYRVTARNKTTNKALQIRLRNTGSYADSVEGIFKSGYTGSTQYQLVLQVK